MASGAGQARSWGSLMSANFEECWELLVDNEGGFTVDDGGATRYGITEAVARRYGYPGPMESLPESTAQSIAQEEYWNPWQLGNLPSWAAFQILDYVYNGGPAYKDAQRVAGVPVDGKPGPMTVSAISEMNPWEFLCRYNSRRLIYLASLQQPQYADGRMNRISLNLLQGSLQ
jgi:lysozyme family protein